MLAGIGCSANAHAWWKSEWTLRKKFTVDTGASGVSINDPIGTTPVLIRLHDGNFQFAGAKEDGSDIRFVAEDDKTPLVYHIERYDTLMAEAFVWVKVPDVKPGARTSFWLYYGNNGNNVASVNDAKGTYDPDAVLVYHFAEHGQPPVDFTAAGNNADKAGQSVDGSMIGGGLRLDGQHLVSIPASSSLAWNDGAVMTWSAWIKAAALQSNAVLFSRREGGNAFVIGVDNGIPYVEVGSQRSGAGAPIAVNVWKHLAVVADGPKITLYLDGEVYATLDARLPTLSSPSLIGGMVVPGSTGFNGEIDELEISKTARPAGFIKFAAASQSGEQGSKLLAFTQDEQPPTGWLSGSMGMMGTLLKSVTIDGWVVIGFLSIMAVVSWYVMISKFIYLNGVEKGTAQFIHEWSHVASDLTQLDHQNAGNVESLGGRADQKLQRVMRLAPLYRIYHIGSNEIRHRLVGSDNAYKGLSVRSIQAIRASLDGGMVRESQNLNAQMVFLTITIAGGPFLGLLGTVIGVMITFAEIAATGEVNINAIAPGIAAALIATVAGLVVAIPSLFGYNYLNSQIKDLMGTMHVFIDEFVTKMAEFYPPDTE